MSQQALPAKQGLYDPRNEHDACGVGFVVDIKGRKSHRIVEQGLQILERLTHRGAVGADPLAGDGAGVLIQIPDELFRAAVGFDLPPVGHYGVGMVFLPKSEPDRLAMQTIIERFVEQQGQEVLGWRPVPVDNSGLGESVLPTEPCIHQIFVGRGANCSDQDAFERKLFVIRKSMDNHIRDAELEGKSFYYVPSMSSRTGGSGADASPAPLAPSPIQGVVASKMKTTRPVMTVLDSRAWSMASS